jgi:hypothetical protein
METPKTIEIDPRHQAIILALLMHPRMENLKRQFQDELTSVLANRHALDSIAGTGDVDGAELSAKGQALVALLSTGASPNQAQLEQFAAVVAAFCLSAAFLNVWGHFTATLSKLTGDDRFIGDVAACCGPCPVDEVRAAIREFGDVKRMPAGKAGM